MNTQSHQSKTGDELSPGTVSQSPLGPSIGSPPTLSGIRSELVQAPPDEKEFEIKLKFGEETHQYVREYIRQADQKATFFFAGSTALIAYLNSLGFISLWMTNPKSWALTHFLSCSATLGLLVGSIFFVSTILPRLDGTARGIIFFNAVREYANASEYAQDVLGKKAEQLCDEKFKHVYELSLVCRAKFVAMTYGIRSAIIGVFSTFVLFTLR